MDEVKQKAIEVLKKGGIVVFPTDTAFGVGCRIDNPDSVKRLFTLRNRPVSQATPVLVSSLSQALPFIKPPTFLVDYLAKRFWPGALTIVVPCETDRVVALVRGGGSTIGIRMPNHIDVLDIISAVGVPILGPSANFHGGVTPFTFEALDPAFLSKVDFVVPGVCKEQKVSTVLDCSRSLISIIRQGAVTIDTAMCVLSLNASEAKRITLGLFIQGRISEKSQEFQRPSSELILPMIETFLSEQSVRMDQLTDIHVVTGPGSFTGLRVGAAIGSMLSMLLSIPINGHPPGTPITLQYDNDNWGK